MEQRSFSLEQILKEGERIYLHSLRTELEEKHLGQYAVIDVESEKHLVGENKLEVIERAQREFGNKLFYIVQIGDVTTPTWNFRNHANPSWSF